MNINNFTAIIEKDEDGFFVGTVPALKSCHTQAKTLPELYTRLHEVIGLCLDVQKSKNVEPVRLNQFIGVQQIEYAF